MFSVSNIVFQLITGNMCLDDVSTSTVVISKVLLFWWRVEAKQKLEMSLKKLSQKPGTFVNSKVAV
jgi:hypothetical protein